MLALQLSNLIEPGQRVLVAVSGGPDSTALLVALEEAGHDVVAAHYDHALQAGSADAADFVRRFCDRLGVELVIERRQKPMPKGSVQAAARALRYDLLERARALTGAGVVALAHTADDVVEGVVLHLLRGCGLAGLRGMPAKRGVFARPMLGAWRSDVVEFLRARGLDALDDPANSNPAYARVRVRHEVLPALERDSPGIKRRLLAVAARATAMQDAVADSATHLLDGGAVSRAAVAAAPEPLAVELMRQLYARAGGAQPALSRANLRSMLALAQPGRGGRGVDLPRRLRLRIVGELMEIVAVGDAEQTEARLEVRACPGCDGAPAVHLKPGLDLRVGHRSPGLRMRPRGGRGTRKLQDIFVDARVPREERDTWPLVFAGDALALVPSVAVDASFTARSDAPGVHLWIRGVPATVESPDSL
jgi:tRNA(Ile)-lysidine synthase